MSSTRVLLPGVLRAAVCALIALCLTVPMPVLFSNPVHAKPGVSAPQQTINFHGHHVHVLVPAGPSPKADPPITYPVPIPGGDVIPPVGMLHAFFPGPVSIGNDGFDIEPSTITNFKGFTGVAMLAGTATGEDSDRIHLKADVVEAGGSGITGTAVIDNYARASESPVSSQGGSTGASLNFRNRQVLIQGQATQSLSANSGLGPAGSIEPVPIPGGDVIPPLIHNFLPGPTSLGFDGIDVEPNGITNFRGFVAQATLAGTATGSDGKTYNLISDMRIFQGEYVSVDGTHHRGTFVLI